MELLEVLFRDFYTTQKNVFVPSNMLARIIANNQGKSPYQKIEDELRKIQTTTHYIAPPLYPPPTFDDVFSPIIEPCDAIGK